MPLPCKLYAMGLDHEKLTYVSGEVVRGFSGEVKGCTARYTWRAFFKCDKLIVVAKVDLETSFFSACVWDRKDPKSVSHQDESRRWWIQQRHLHNLHLSAEVLRELSDPSFHNREDALALTAAIRVSPITLDVLGLAKIFVRERVMPGPAEEGDAIHVAVSVVHGIEFLLTWNVKHLANPNKRAHLRMVCLRAGFTVPDLVTPEDFWNVDEDLP